MRESGRGGRVSSVVLGGKRVSGGLSFGGGESYELFEGGSRGLMSGPRGRWGDHEWCLGGGSGLMIGSWGGGGLMSGPREAGGG